MQINTGEIILLTGYLVAHSMLKEQLKNERTNSMIIGESFKTIRDSQTYRFLDRVDYPEPIAGLVLGYSRRNTGYIESLYSSYSDLEPPEYQGNALNVDQSIRVVMVMPIGKKHNAYYTPVAVLPEQIRKLE